MKSQEPEVPFAETFSKAAASESRREARSTKSEEAKALEESQAPETVQNPAVTENSGSPTPTQVLAVCLTAPTTTDQRSSITAPVATSQFVSLAVTGDEAAQQVGKLTATEPVSTAVTQFIQLEGVRSIGGETLPAEVVQPAAAVVAAQAKIASQEAQSAKTGAAPTDGLPLSLDAKAVDVLQKAQVADPAPALSQPVAESPKPGAEASSQQSATRNPQSPIHALQGVTVVRPENADQTQRNAAMERPTMASPVSEGHALLAVEPLTVSASGEGSDVANSFGQDGSTEDRHPSSTSSSGATGAAGTGTPGTAGLGGSDGSVRSDESVADVATEPASLKQPLDVEERIRIVDQVRGKIDAMRMTSGRGEVTLRLTPEHLGEVKLTLTLGGADRNEITARILAETSQARLAMSEGREQLRMALEQKGYVLQSMDVGTLAGKDAESNRFGQGQPRNEYAGAHSFESNSGQGFSAFANQAHDRRGGVRQSPVMDNQSPITAQATPITDLRSPVSGKRQDGRLDYSA